MSGVQFSAYSALNAARPTDVASTAKKAEGAGNPITEGVSGFRDAIRQAEQTAIETAATGADPHAMVQALANAEVVLDTAVTIRDKVVEAYQELLRMPV